MLRENVRDCRRRAPYYLIPSRMEAQNALLANIKQKGPHSYYYAHQPRTPTDPAEARVLEGEGIVNGGIPKLAEVREVQALKPVVMPIRNYSWADETDKVTVIIPFTAGTLTAEQVEHSFEAKKVEVSLHPRDLEEYRLTLSNLSHSILPEESRIRVKANRVTLTLKKEIESKWFELLSAKKGAMADE